MAAPVSLRQRSTATATLPHAVARANVPSSDVDVLPTPSAPFSTPSTAYLTHPPTPIDLSTSSPAARAFEALTNPASAASDLLIDARVPLHIAAMDAAACMPHLRRLHDVTLPIRYNDAFYSQFTPCTAAALRPTSPYPRPLREDACLAIGAFAPLSAFPQFTSNEGVDSAHVLVGFATGRAYADRPDWRAALADMAAACVDTLSHVFPAALMGSCGRHRRSAAPRGYILSVGVAPAFRNRSVARALVCMCMTALVHVYGCEDVYLHVMASNAIAQRVYARLGYTLVRREYGLYRIDEVGHDGLYMCASGGVRAVTKEFVHEHARSRADVVVDAQLLVACHAEEEDDLRTGARAAGRVHDEGADVSVSVATSAAAAL